MNILLAGMSRRKGAKFMIDFHDAKTKKIISSVIIIFLVLAMVVPTIASLLSY